MKSFFERKFAKTREKAEKESLTNELKSRMEDVILSKIDGDGAYVTNDEAGLSLCTILEAIFIHGIKESITDRVVTIMGDPDVMPTPEFWSPMLLFTHRNIIEQVHQMKQINTDVGRSRAWLRVSLNDGSLLAYMELIYKQNKSLARYYNKSAYLRDLDSIGLATNILQSLGQFAFSFPVNSSILNYWPNAPLLLAGLWTPPMKYCPVSTGLDLAKNLPLSGEVESISELIPHDISAVANSELDEDEALEILLNTPIEGSPLLTRYEKEQKQYLDSESNESCDEGSAKPTENFISTEVKDDDKIQVEIKQEENTVEQIEEPSNVDAEPNENKIEPVKDISTESYEKILDNYNPRSNAIYKESSLREFLDSQEPSSAESLDESNKHEINEMGFEVIDKSTLPLNKEDMRVFLKILTGGAISQEAGLDSQQFTCKKCGILIGLSHKKPKVCAFTCFYYCEECFDGVQMKIPARILHNWDFAKYFVSASSQTFLTDVINHPLLDIRKINSKIYLAVDQINDIRKLRVKLNLMRPYLSTCHDSMTNVIKQLVWPREYLYEHVHRYSVSDLYDLDTGKLSADLKTAVHLSNRHIKSCELCNQKGFICELCNNKEQSPDLIFPFDDNTHRCQVCCNVVHLACYQEHKECRKCKRRKDHKAKLERLISEENS